MTNEDIATIQQARKALADYAKKVHRDAEDDNDNLDDFEPDQDKEE